MLSAFLHGFILALGLILPLGPQNVFVLSQGATQPRFRNALPVVLTASLCDTLLILLAVLGVSLVVLSVAWIKVVLVVVGVAFLVYMGWLTWRSKPASDDPALDAQLWPARRQIIFAMSVSLLNPHAILDTIGVIGTSSLAYLNSDKVAFTFACILNSWLWFFALAIVGRRVGSIARVRRVLNRVSAIIMWLSAIYLVYNLIVIRAA
jgi:L-lysine exporter family protein LysE/ArgO